MPTTNSILTKTIVDDAVAYYGLTTGTPANSINVKLVGIAVIGSDVNGVFRD
jgi:hypothetical protein